MIMKKSAFMLLIILLSLTANAQTPYRNEDGKKIDKEELETKDYLPEIHGTIRTKFEYQTEMAASRFEVRNARISITGNVLPIVAYKAEIDLSDEGQIKMLDAYARLFPIKDLTVTTGQMRVPLQSTPTALHISNISLTVRLLRNKLVMCVTLVLHWDINSALEYL